MPRSHCTVKVAARARDAQLIAGTVHAPDRFMWLTSDRLAWGTKVWLLLTQFIVECLPHRNKGTFG